jgi:Transglycosylase SLT domain
MDVLEQFFSGSQTQPSQPAQSKSSSVITDQLLDSLRRVESGKDKFALNKETKAMGPYQFMPETVQMLHKQGIEFNPFNEQQAREAAKTYLNQLVERNKGDVDKALAQYGGFVTKDPSAYIGKVKQGATQQPEPVAQSTTKQTNSIDPLEAFFENKPMAQALPASGAGAGRGSYAGYSAAEDVVGKTKQIKEKLLGKKPTATEAIELSTTIPEEAQSDLRPLYEVPRAIAQNLAASIASGYGAIAKGVQTGSLEQAGAIQKEIQEKYGYEPSSPVSKKVLELLNLPVEYVVQPAAKFVGDIAQSVTGSPMAGGVVAGTLETAPMLLGLRKGAVKPGITREVSALERQKAAMNDTNLPPSVRAAIAEKTAKGEVMTPEQIQAAQTQFETSKQNLKAQAPTAPKVSAAAVAGAQEAQRKSVGAMAVPDSTTIQQALSVATPELQAALKNIPTDKVNLPTFQRHIEADTLPVPIRLTEGQATGDIIKISEEQNRRGKDPELARRFNEQNSQLIENINEIRKNAAPDVYGTKTIENSQGIIDAYKTMDANLNDGINSKYQALRDAAGGQFPVDAPKLLQNIEGKLKKELLSNEAPKGQFSELQRLAKDNNMTFEDYLSLRRNLGDIARTAKDGAERKAASFMIEELEKLPLQESAKRLKPLADQARKAARDRFQMLEKDPAYKAAVDDSVPADKYIDKFVINGVNKNIGTMIQHLGKDSAAHQHMAAGTVNWLRDKAGVIDEKSNFSQKQYNAALKKLDDVNNLHEIFNPEAASQLKTLGNVANYTQFQPRGAFVNNSNTLVGALAQQARNAVGKTVEGGLNVAVPGLQLGTSVMEMRARRAAEAETKKSLELGAGTKQTGKNKIQDLNK